MSQTGVPSITTEQVDLVSVTGPLDDSGLFQLRKRLDLLLYGGTRFLAVDLSQVDGSDNRLFDLLTRTSELLEHRGGWLRLIGLGSTVLDTLDDAALPEVRMVYRASDWARHATRPRDTAGAMPRPSA